MAEFNLGNGMALPFADKRFDAAAMALVLVFVPEPAQGVAEMVTVVRPGGIVAAYIWDMLGGGFPLDPILAEMRAMGWSPPQPPRPKASRIETMQALWARAGLEAVETRTIEVQRSFIDFETFWSINAKNPTLAPIFATTTHHDIERLKSPVRSRLSAEAGGPISYGARTRDQRAPSGLAGSC